jgi:hypothetical protein
VAEQLPALACDVFVTAYIDAMHATVVVTIGFLAVAALIIKSRRRVMPSCMPQR